MSCNLPVSESLLFLQRALAFSAYTCFIDPMSLRHFRGYGGVAHLQLEALTQTLLVLRLHGNLLQYGDTLLLVSQVVHLTPRYSMPLLISGTCEQGVERALHLKQFW